MSFDESGSAIDRINRRLDALESQVAYLTELLGGSAGAWSSGGQPVPPQPVAGVPVPSSGYGTFGPAGPPGGFPDVVALARSGKKIEAIKLYRQYTSVGLKEAKYFVDNC